MALKTRDGLHTYIGGLHLLTHSVPTASHLVLIPWKMKSEGEKDSISSYKKKNLGNSLAVRWLGLHASTAEARVRSLVGELRSHPWHGQNQNKSKTKLNRKISPVSLLVYLFLKE